MAEPRTALAGSIFRNEQQMPANTQATVAFLSRPNTYADAAFAVSTIETQMSWVFLTRDYALKLKKPLHNALLDFRSVEARCNACREELRLNRRLAPAIYLTVETISTNHNGDLQFGSGVDRVDCVVRMRRLPDRVMLSDQLLRGPVRQGVLERVAQCMARFHRRLPSLQPTPLNWRKSMGDAIDCNEAVLRAYPDVLPSPDAHYLCQQQRIFLMRHADWIDARIHQGWMVEGHGDLRAEHVFVGDELPSEMGDDMVNQVGAIDCLEFSAALRQLDCADEIAFLALDCERLAGEAVGNALLEHYQTITQDYPPPALLHFYQSFRAAIRARLALLRLSEQSHRPRDAWINRAEQWLQLAHKHAAFMRQDQVCISAEIDPPS